MNDSTEKDRQLNEKKSVWSFRAGICFAYLLSITWSIQAFFLWLFLGMATYSLFLAWHFGRKARGEKVEYDRPIRGTTKPSQASAWLIRRAILFFMASIGIVLLVLFVRRILTPNGEERAVQEISHEEPTASELQRVNQLSDQGTALYNKGQYDSAIVFYDMALAIHPASDIGLYNKALVYYSKQEPEMSVKLLFTCISKNPEYGMAYWLMGTIHSDRNQQDSSKFYFDRAYETGLRDPNFLQTLAGLYETVDKDRAIQLYEESLVQDSSLTESYRRLIDLDPDHADEYKRALDRRKSSGGVKNF